MAVHYGDFPRALYETYPSYTLAQVAEELGAGASFVVKHVTGATPGADSWLIHTRPLMDYAIEGVPVGGLPHPGLTLKIEISYGGPIYRIFDCIPILAGSEYNVGTGLMLTGRYAKFTIINASASAPVNVGGIITLRGGV